MSIKSEIERIRGHIADSYAAVAEAGGTLPAQRNSASLAGSIRSIPKLPPIYGVKWDGSSTKLTRTDDAAGFANPAPAVGTGAGSSPFDRLMPWAGMARVTQDGNQLVAIPKYWLKVSHDPFCVQISPHPVPGFQVSPAHRDRGDGKGERDVVYLGRYVCNSAYQSKTGQTPYVTRVDLYRTNIHNLGAAYWQADYAIQLTWLYLYLVEFASWNGQEAIGRGVVDGSAVIATGGTDSMLYHTGRAAGTDGLTAIQYRYIENPWGSIREYRDGVIFYNTAIYTCSNPANFSNDYTAAGYGKRSNPRVYTSGWISKFGHDEDDPSFIFPSETAGSETTYVTDYYNNSIGKRNLVVSNIYNSGNQAGPFYFSGAINGMDSSFANTGSRLQKLP